MPFEHYIRQDGKRLRCGYTTGSCAALAAQAATVALLTGAFPQSARILTPKGIPIEADVLDGALGEGFARCAVQKDAGDDADITNGILVVAEARRARDPGITVDGGIGVGRVTRPGLDQPVGMAAINRVPRVMIAREVEAACDGAGYDGGIAVTISIPRGEELAVKTFNPNLGIVGGLSVIGTSGIVEPMSLQALADSIEAEMKMLTAEGHRRLIVTPGNYGEDFLPQIGAPEGVARIKCSNFVGETLELAGTLGFREVLLVGHIGKFVKLAGGILNTHSRYGDCRTEIVAAHAAMAGIAPETARALMDCATTDACIAVLDDHGLRETVMTSLMTAVGRQTARRAQGRYALGVMMFSNVYGLLGQTENTETILNAWKTG